MAIAPKTANAVKIGDALTINRKSPEYKLGLAQLAEWHARCMAKRLGIKRKEKDLTPVASVETAKERRWRNEAVDRFHAFGRLRDDGPFSAQGGLEPALASFPR